MCGRTCGRIATALAAVAGLATFGIPVTALAMAPVAGDTIIAEQNGPEGTGQVVGVNYFTGEQNLISSNATSLAAGGAALFHEPFDVAIQPSGTILVADRGADNDSNGGANQPDGEIVSVNPGTGAQTLLTSGGELYDPVGVSVASNGDIWVADFSHPGTFNNGAIVKVSPAGAQTLVSSENGAQGDLIPGPTSVFVDPSPPFNGHLVVVSDFGGADGLGSVVDVNPANGNQTEYSSNATSPTTPYSYPNDLALAGNGDLYVANGGTGGVGPALLRLSGGAAATKLATTGTLSEPYGTAIDVNGSIELSDTGSLYRITTAGAQSALAQGLGGTPRGIAIEPGAPQQPLRTLTVSTAGAGAGTITSSPAGINCGGGQTTCTAGFSDGSTVTLTATPNATSNFDGFSGSCTGARCSVTIGATQSVTGSFSVKDLTPPETIKGKGPKKTIHTSKATFAFSSEAGAAFACHLDKKPFAPCTSPKVVKRLKKGKHTFTVDAIDAAGNFDATPLVWKFKVVR